MMEIQIKLDNYRFIRGNLFPPQEVEVLSRYKLHQNPSFCSRHCLSSIVEFHVKRRLHVQNVNLHYWSSIVEFRGKHKLHVQNVNLHCWSSIVEFHRKPRLHVQNVNLCCQSSIVEFSVKHGLHMQNMNLCTTELRKYAHLLDMGQKLTRAIALKEETMAFQIYTAGEVQTS